MPVTRTVRSACPERPAAIAIEQMDDWGSCLHMVFVLSLGLFSPFVILIGARMGIVLSWQFGYRSFMAVFRQTGVKVLRVRLNFSETL
jgi:Na+/H+-translocating membrane pyrophosphatase